jgi:hypothetical protein
MAKPPFNTALGAFEATQQAKPPVRFDGVLSNVLPLRANMSRLTAFCDDYLNLAPDIIRFRPAVPWVYLMVLDYGRMAAKVENFGWVAQHEIAFAVPLEWYAFRDGSWQFVDWASVCPYIFVDNEMSLSTGREVYGWPKVQVSLDPDLGPWVSDPTAPQPLLTASAALFPELYAGQRPRAETFLRIRQQPPPWRTRLPPDPDRFDPLGTLSRAISGFFGGFGRLTDMAAALPIRGFPTDALPTSLLNLVRRGPRYVTAFGAPPPPLNNITLKQFRDAEDPARVCYQAITNSLMTVKRFNGGGMLGDVTLMLGDPSGGIDVALRRSPSLPIVEGLGLEVGPDGGDRDMVSLRPTMPFWVNVDLEYGNGETLCWRTRTSSWHTDPTVADPPAPSCPAEPEGHRFNTARGVGPQDVVGPFQFPNTTVRVLPLLADDATLRQVCHDQLTEGCPFRIEPWGSYVYLVISTFGEMSSAGDVGWWADREATFFVPVKLFATNQPHDAIGVALLPVFAFADPQTAAVVEREVNGRPTLGATIASPSGPWLSESGPAGDNATLATLDTLMMPALYVGQRGEWRRLLALTEVDALAFGDTVGWNTIARQWLDAFKNEVRRKAARTVENPEAFADARDLAVEVLAGRLPISMLTVKQFRDVAEPDCACYQALVRCDRVIRRLYDLREIESRVHLRIHRNPAIDVVARLGLSVKCTETTEAGVVDIIQPIRPFWARVAMREDLGQTLCSRTGDTWHRHGSPLVATDPSSFASNQTPADYMDIYPQKVEQAAALAEPHGRNIAAVIESAEPQLVIDSMLSHEWGNWGDPHWYRRQQDGTNEPTKPTFCIPCHTIAQPDVRAIELIDRRSTAWWFVAAQRTDDGRVTFSEGVWSPPA